MKILMIASECAPFAKSGGLADAVAGLSKALFRAGHDVRIVMPYYRVVKGKAVDLGEPVGCCVHMGRGEENWVAFRPGKLDGSVPIEFLEYDRFYDRGGLYDEGGHEYSDNAFRFALLSKAAMQRCKDSGFIPDVMHCHDWMSALTPLFLKTWDRILSPLSATASVLTIHNIGYQGVFHSSAFSYLGVSDDWFRSDVLEDHGRLNLLKAGIYCADAITTVSPTHAQELLTAEGGMGLAPYLNRRRADFVGVLNGVDDDVWNPEIDPMIPARYSADELSGKAECKAALQRRFGLEVDPSVPLFGMVSRLAAQKGIHLIREAVPRALGGMRAQFVLMGSGDRSAEDFLHWLAGTFPGRAGTYVGYSEEISHWIEAGADFFLMPSIYEPCGLNQIYSLRYGTLPLVRRTGGLADTVLNYNEATADGTGFVFDLPTPQALFDTIGWAVSTWYDRSEHIGILRKRAMEQRFSWDASAQKMIEVYRGALRRKRGDEAAGVEVAEMSAQTEKIVPSESSNSGELIAIEPLVRNPMLERARKGVGKKAGRESWGQ